MGMHFDSLLNDDAWTPMETEQQQFSPNYYWHDGRRLHESPADFVETFRDAMWISLDSIDVMSFNRSPLKVAPNFVVPRHHHTTKEQIFIFQGEYSIEYGPEDNPQTVLVKPGNFFLSYPGTPYTMTAGPEGVTYIETWPHHVMGGGDTIWYDVGWKKKEGVV
jgi:mannose-6-phosphate isomerase-like protein (cupin superfamily)